MAKFMIGTGGFCGCSYNGNRSSKSQIHYSLVSRFPHFLSRAPTIEQSLSDLGCRLQSRALRILGPISWAAHIPRRKFAQTVCTASATSAYLSIRCPRTHRTLYPRVLSESPPSRYGRRRFSARRIPLPGISNAPMRDSPNGGMTECTRMISAPTSSGPMIRNLEVPSATAWLASLSCMMGRSGTETHMLGTSPLPVLLHTYPTTRVRPSRMSWLISRITNAKMDGFLRQACEYQMEGSLAVIVWI